MNVSHHTLQSKLEESFSQFRDNIAFEGENKSLSYSEVERRANYIANWIVSKGMEVGTFIGILLANRMELIFTIIGVIKAGCVFVPLEPAYPDKRIKAMIKNTDIGVVIIDKTNYKRFARYEGDKEDTYAALPGMEFILIDELFLKGDHRWWREKPLVSYDPEAKIYIYFTSGTTGIPKSILGKNKSLLHFINWEINTFGINESFRFSQFTPPGFDVFLRDILVPLCAGAVICIPDYQQVLLNSHRLTPWIAANRITLIHCVPSLFRLFNAYNFTEKETFKHLEYVLFAGERINPLELKLWYERNGEHTQLVNLYGPTETTLAKVFYFIQRPDAHKKNIPIGQPIDGARVIILDQNMDICDELVVGELYIRTPYRSFGYYNDPELNKQKFIPNPFINDPKEILYKTGDLGRMLPDGNIELVGRVDRQVKIRGRRIELEEIETLLQHHPGVKETAVIKKDVTSDNAFLHAFIVPKRERVTSKEEESFIRDIKEYLLNELPDYMVPTSITKLEQLPRKTNLKVDFDLLGDMLKKEEREYIAPSNEVETKLVEIWSELLGMEKEKISVTSGFFELGGNSLNMMTLTSRIHRIFNIKIFLDQIFDNPTIEKQAAIINGAEKDKYTSIESTEKRDYYELSSAQKRLYILYQMDGQSTRYNLSSVIVLSGELHRDRFEHAIRELIRRHASLRTSFHLVNDQPVQRVHDEVAFDIEYHDAARFAPGAMRYASTIKDFIRPFDLSRAPLLRVGLIKLEEKKHIFMYDMHHIITDGTSQELLKNEFLIFYAQKELTPLPIQYKDYSQWQNQQKQRQIMTQQEEYWLRELAGEISVLSLFTDYVRPAERSFEGNRVDFEISEEDIERLRTLALEEGITLYMVVLAIFILFLGKVCSQEEIIVGTPTAGRIHEDLEKIIGMFVNTLVITSSPIGEKTIKEFLKEIKEKTLGAFENQWYQFEDLVNQLTLPRDVSRNPIFDVMFVFHNIEAMRANAVQVEPDTPGLDAQPWGYQKATAKFDLTLRIIESNHGVDFSFDYCTKLFKEETIEHFAAYFKNAAAGILKDRNQEISGIEIISPQEKEQLLKGFNQTGSPYPKDKTIHELFEEQVEKAPDNTGLVFKTNRFNYRKLNERSNQLARLLRKKGVQPGTIVGIIVEPSSEMIIGILGVLKAGGAYLPIEPASPGERIRYMLTESKAKILLLQKHLTETAQQARFNGETIDIEDRNIYEGESSNLENKNTPTDLLYLIYTSGTTGKPKGVLLKHENLVNYSSWFVGSIGVTGDDKSVLTSSFAFDLGYTAVYPLLLKGGELHLISGDIYLSPEALIDYIAANRITYMKVTPTLFSLIVNSPGFLAEKCQLLRVVVLGGEPIKVKDVEQAHQVCPHLWMMNHYGPTETAIGSVARLIDFHQFEAYRRNATIGKPILNTQLYILDKYLKLVSIYTPGELCIGGKGVAWGYMNRQELTAERFIPNPFADGGWLYRTGDIASWQRDGNIKLFGRTDDQVKIRGYRIQLRGVEHHLLSHEDIKDAAVIDRENQAGEKYLCAYYVSDKPLSVAQLREYLLKELPEYMIPTYFVQLLQIPLGNHNKVNRNTLPEPGKETEDEYMAPRNRMEKKLTEIWQQVLGRERIGINENFFMIGGDSIKTIQIISRLNKLGYKLSMRDIFQYPFILELAPLVKKLERTADQSVITGTIPLTPIQKRFFAMPSFDRHHYNQSVMLYSNERLEETGIHRVFRKIQDHHDVLRMTFKELNGQIVQTNHGLEYPLSIEVVDFCDHENGENAGSGEDALKALEQRANRVQSSIDLEKGPLMKVGLFHLENGDYLLIAVHHLVIDAVSQRILLEDIENLYRQYKKGEPFALPLKTDSFKLWAEELSVYANSEQFLKEKDYWAKLSTAAAGLESIPRDFDIEDKPVKDKDRVSFCLSEEETENLLTKVNEPFGTEINDVLLTALALAICKTYGHHKAFIALEGHGREEVLSNINITRTIGWFTSVFPVILDVSYKNDLSRQVKEVKESLRQVPNKGVGYGILRYLTAEEHKGGIDFSRNPQVNFNYLGQFDADLEQTSFGVAKESMGRYQSPKRQQKYELEVIGLIGGKRLELFIDFNKRQYRKKTIETLTNHLRTELIGIISFCTARKEKEHTPSDFTYKKLSIDTLEWLSSQYTIEDIYILTPMQEGMLFHTVYDKRSSTYFEQASYRICGELDVETVRKSFNELFRRYDILSTAFIYEGKGIDCPLQLVLKDRETQILYEDLQRLGKEYTRDQREVLIKEFKENDRRQSFDLGKDVLMRLAVLQLEDTEFEFVWSHHHILMDGWCTGILITEFFEIYNSYLENRPYKLSPVQSFRTYIQWLEKRDKNESKQYWEKYLEDYDQLTEIPKINILYPHEYNEEDEGYKNAQVSLRLEREETRRLNELAGRNNVTLNTMIQALWGILLGKYNSRRDVVFGTVVSGRPSGIQGVESMVGLFINTIPVRIRYNEKTTFKELLRQVQEAAIDSESYHYYPLAEIQSAHPLKQNLLDHILIFENYPITEQIEGVISSGSENNQGSPWELSNIDRFEQSSYDFNLVVGPGEQLQVVFSYNANVYEEGFVRKIFGHLKKVLDQVLTQAKRPVAAFTLLSEEDKEQILLEFNNTHTDYPKHKTIYQLIEEQASQTSDGVAVIGPDAKSIAAKNEQYIHITYREINKRANQLARVLTERGVKPDDIVGIMIKHSLEMIIGILGVWKAGGAYLPIDPGNPGERILYMLENSAIDIIIIDEDQYADQKNWQRVDIYDASIYSRDMTNPGIVSQPCHAAYVIYTSGSTGRPKGVIVEHRNLTNTLLHRKEEYGMDSESASLQLFSCSFDGFLTSFFTPIISGAKVVFLSIKGIKDLASIKEAVVNHQVTHFISIPSLYEAIIENLTKKEAAALKTVTLAGEKLLSHILEITKQKNEILEIVNEYGVTEAAVMSTIYRHQERDRYIKIGRPIWNNRIYILDNQQRLQPIGIVGELCITGAGIARGYLNNPELTNSKFQIPNYKQIPNFKLQITNKEDGINQKFLRGGPVAPRRGEPIRDGFVAEDVFDNSTCTCNLHLSPLAESAPPGRRRQKMYKTGDLARWLLDGAVEFLGRRDHQVKIRGFRIEPGEIENQLLTHPEIRAAVVMLGETPEGKKEEYLCAYIVTHRKFEVSELRRFLSGTLPNHMIPSYFINIEKIPLNPSGKVDRKALVKDGSTLGTGIEFVAPGNELEKIIADAWKYVLKKDKVGIHDNFFDIGGDSLKAIRLNSRLNDLLNKKVSIVVLFEHVTIHSFIRYLNHEETRPGVSKRRIDRSEVIDKVKKTRADRKMKRRWGNVNA